MTIDELQPRAMPVEPVRPLRPVDDADIRRRGPVSPLRMPPTAPAPGRRPDIQGLRAVAVVLVVADHLTDSPRGGFLGVDVFFVISGYLITGLLLRHLGPAATDRRPGRALRSFYWRRITRLLPASLVVTLATLVGAQLLFGAGRWQDTLRDGYWATGFLANIHFADVGTDYFAADRPVSPLQHYWSLSVEEQFYVVWPLALLAASVLAARVLRSRLTDASRWLVVLPVLVTVVSFGWALHQADASRTAAYFATPARAWELGLGAIVACLALRLRPAVATVLSVTGLIVILVSAFVINDSVGLPAPGALLPCLGAALCVAAVSADGTGARNPVLTNRVATHLGDISYSIYLVHFPVIVLLATRFPAHSGVLYVAALLLTLGSATLLHHLVEKPGMTFGSRTGSLRALRVRRGTLLSTARATGFAVAVAMLGLSVLSLAPAKSVARAQLYDTVQAALRLPAPATVGVGPAATALTGEIRSALRARTWPALAPSIDAEATRLQVPAAMVVCGGIDLQPAARCTFGPKDAPHTLYLAGDSTAMAYAAAYRAVVTAVPGWNLRIGAAYGCGFSSVVLSNSDADVVAGCAAHNAAVVRDLAQVAPDVVLVTNTYTARTSHETGALLTETQWGAAVAAELALVPSGTRVGIVEPAPLATDPYTCYQPGSTPIDCVAHIYSAHQSRGLAERRLATTHDWTFTPTEAWFCDLASGYCPAFAAGVPIRHDSLHVTYAYDAVIAPVLLESLQKAQVLP